MPAPAPETFVDELCKHLVAGDGYLVLGVAKDGRVRPHGIVPRGDFGWPVSRPLPGLDPLARAFDRVLLRSDGTTLEVLCIQDRVTRPERRVAIGVDEVRAAGAACLPPGAERGSGARVLIRIWEVGAAGDHAHLEGLRKNPAVGRVGITAAAFEPGSDRVWTNAALLGGWEQAASARRALRAARAGEAPVTPSEIGHQGRRPVVTITILAVLVVVYVLELATDRWGRGGLTPSLPSLVAIGALQRDLALGGQWYRMASATLLHGSPFHLLMNGIALYFGGVLLERLIGRAWFLTVFGLSALGGSALSLVANRPESFSVGASGAIMGVFGAALAVSYRMPYGGARTWVQSAVLRVLVPSLMPLFLFPGGPRIDFWAHLGGAITGLAVGLFLLRSWPRSEPHPHHRRLATALAGVSVVVLAAGLAMALALQPEMARMISRQLG